MPDMGVAPLAIIKHLDVLEDAGPDIGSGAIVFVAHQLCLQGMEEALCNGIVPAVALPAHWREFKASLRGQIDYFLNNQHKRNYATSILIYCTAIKRPYYSACQTSFEAIPWNQSH